MQVDDAAAAEQAKVKSATPATSLARDAGVGNLRAVGITMAAAALGFVGLLLFGVILPPAVPLILSAAGYAAARFYSAKRAISALSGALLGTMTGVWLFLVIAIFSGILSFGLASPEGQDMLKGLSPKMAQIYQPIEDPHKLFALLIVIFFGLILSATFGGLLAARIGRSNR